MNVIGSTAALSTLLLGFATFARGNSAVHLGLVSSGFVGTAVIIFAVAAIEALRSLRPRTYRGPTVHALRDVADKYLMDGEVQALKMVMHTQVTILAEAKRSNGWKADRLENAVGFEVGGAAVLAVGVILVLLGA